MSRYAVKTVTHLFKGPFKLVSGDEVNFKVCPRCRREKWRFYVSLSKGLGWCHHCKYSPVLSQLIESTNFEIIDLDFLRYYGEKIKEEANKKLEELPQDLVDLDCYTHPMHPVNLFIRRRRYTKELFKKYNAKFCTSGIHKDRIVFPFYNLFGEYRGFQGRLVYPSSEAVPKWRHSKGMNKNDILFNYENVRNKKVCVLVEGIFDCLRQPEWSVAMFGKKPSRGQIEMLEYFQHVYVMLDNDAVDEAKKLALTLFNNSVSRVRPIILEKGDPDDHKIEDLVSIITSQVPSGWPNPCIV